MRDETESMTAPPVDAQRLRELLEAATATRLRRKYAQALAALAGSDAAAQRRGD